MKAPAIPVLLLSGVGVLWATAPLHAQELDRGEGRRGEVIRGREETGTLVMPALRVPGPAPEVDGDLSDPCWRRAPVATGFTQMEPREGEPATEQTEVRVLYGPEALFVAFRAFDTSPDSIAGQLTRRDQDSYSDWVHLLVDSYHDRRTAFHFGVNPRGVKLDIYHFDDTEEDDSWDAVWEVATGRDPEGWTAEFRIPYSQLRFGNHPNQTWGINFAREIARRNEVSTWAPIRQSDAALVSLSGELRGLRNLGSPTRLELRPFTLARLTRAPGEEANPFFHANDAFASGGLDLKYGVTNDLTLDLTVNPDFGQVEADPARVNLTAFETFYPEKRPFFIEGAGIFRFGIGIGDGDLGSESLFYSRRIGRPPQGSVDGRGGFTDVPETSTILGAWKLSGKTQGGWSIGLMHAVTAQEDARVATGDGERLEEPVEPFSNYGVARVQKDFREGRSALGLIATAVNRDRTVAEELHLRSGAYTGGLDFRHRFGSDDRFLVNGYALASHVKGSEEAMALTQRAPGRYFHRPDADHVRYDSTRTSLTGWAGKLEVLKVGGGYWRWGTSALVKSPGFEPNDLGYQQASDLVLHAGFLGYNHYNPTEHLRRWNLNVNAWHGWTFGGERVSTGGNLNGSLTLHSYWSGYAGVNRELETFSDGMLRGGPLMRQEARTNGWFGINSDSRKPVRISWNNNWAVASESDSWSANTSLSLRWRPSGRMEVSLGPFFNRNLSDLQWVGRVRTSRTHYLFGRMDQKTVGLTGRMDLTFIPDLTLQVYAQPFVSAGSYGRFKEITDPRAPAWEDRFRFLEPVSQAGGYRVDLDGDGTPETFGDPDFSVQQFRSTAVLRWEYRPGSLLYLVWSQGRNYVGGDGRLRFEENLGNLFGQEAENVFMLKLSYWITP